MRLGKTILLGVAMLVASAVFAQEASTVPEVRETNQEETRVERVRIPFSVKYELSRTVGAGRMVKKQDGKDGAVIKTFKVVIENGKPVGKELVSTTRTEPTDCVYLIGKTGFESSRGTWVRSKVIDMVATAYEPYAGISRKGPPRTASGIIARFGVVAVDPRVIPLGTMVFVEGYGFAKAADTGGAIKGHRIDLCFPTEGQARQFGRRKVKVHILSSR